MRFIEVLLRRGMRDGRVGASIAPVIAHALQPARIVL
jgi:hypothetical protein